MKAGSIVACISDPTEGFKPSIFAGIAMPKVGQLYVCIEVKPCRCGKHDIVGLEELPLLFFDAKHFREVQPPMDVSFVQELQAEQSPAY